MGNIFFVPEWFYGYDLLLELGFMLVTLLVSYYALKVYRLTQKHQVKLFGISFILFSLSYFIESIVNFLVVFKLNETICSMLQLKDMSLCVQWLVRVNLTGIYAHIVLFLVGLVTLTYMTAGCKGIKLYSLLLVLAFVGVFCSANMLHTFYLVSTILLSYIVVHYVGNYLKSMRATTLLVLVAFVFLWFGHFHFIISVDHQLYYVIGHVLEFIAYLCILANLVLITRKGKLR